MCSAAGLLATGQHIDIIKMLSSIFIPQLYCCELHILAPHWLTIYVQHDMRNIHSGTLIYEISDHLPFFVLREKIFSCISLNDNNMKLISDQLKKTDFFLNNRNVDNAYEAFTNLLTEITDTYSPLKEVIIHHKNVITNPCYYNHLKQ